MKNQSETAAVVANGQHYLVTYDPSSKFYWDAINEGNWEPGTYETFAALLKPEDTFVDVGAFIGATLLFAQSICSRSLAIEADEINFQMLSKNVALNPQLAEAIDLHHIAVGPERGKLRLSSGYSGISTRSTAVEAGGSFVDGDQHVREWDVEVIELTDFLMEQKVQDPVFIKIDIEGLEYNIRSSLSQIVNQRRDYVIFLALHPHIVAKSGRPFHMKLVKAPWVFFIRFLRSVEMVFAIRKAPNIYRKSGDKISCFDILRFGQLRGASEIIITDREW